MWACRTPRPHPRSKGAQWNAGLQGARARLASGGHSGGWGDFAPPTPRQCPAGEAPTTTTARAAGSSRCAPSLIPAPPVTSPSPVAGRERHPPPPDPRGNRNLFPGPGRTVGASRVPRVSPEVPAGCWAAGDQDPQLPAGWGSHARAASGNTGLGRQRAGVRGRAWRGGRRCPRDEPSLGWMWGRLCLRLAAVETRPRLACSRGAVKLTRLQ